MSPRAPRPCRRCGEPVEQPLGRGRPKLEHDTCRRRPARPCRCGCGAIIPATADQRQVYATERCRRRHTTLVDGIPGSDYDRIAEAQSGECAICRRRPAQRLVVDRDPHGTVRGLLCRPCAVVTASNGTALLRATADYLEIPR